MELSSYFEKFLRAIRPTENQINDMKSGHETLRKRLLDNEDTKDIIISIFLQGSYRRSTAIRPKGDNHSDVDIVVVTNLDKEDYPNPSEAMYLFEKGIIDIKTEEGKKISKEKRGFSSQRI